MKNIEKIFENEKTLNTVSQNTTMQWPDSSYRVINKPRGKGKHYKDHFGMAVAGFEKELRSPEAKNRERIPVTLAELIENAKQVKAERERQIALEKKIRSEREREESWGQGIDPNRRERIEAEFKREAEENM